MNLTKSQSTKLRKFKTTSGKIRYLHSLDWTRSEIKDKLKIRYQWVRNVLVTPITKAREA